MNIYTPEIVQIHRPDAAFQATFFTLAAYPSIVSVKTPGAKMFYLHSMSTHTDLDTRLKIDKNVGIPFQAGLIFRGEFRELKFINLGTIGRQILVVWSGDKYFDVDRVVKQATASMMIRELYE